MCAVSNIGDYGRKTWPQPWMPYTPDTAPPLDYWPADTPSRIEWEEFKKLFDKAKEFDEKTGQPDCEADEKTAWMKDMEDRIKQLELLKKESAKASFDFAEALSDLRDNAVYLERVDEAIGGTQFKSIAQDLRRIANLMETQID